MAQLTKMVRDGRVQQWWHARTPLQRRLMIGGATVAVLVPTVIVVRRIMRPNPITNVTDQGNDVALGPREEIDEALRGPIRATARRGAVNPFEITSDFVKRYAPNCRRFPEAARNPGEARLYVESFVQVVRIMVEDQLISDAQRNYFLEMVSVWGKSQGLTASQLPSPVPQTASQA